MPRRTRKRGGADLDAELIRACQEGNNSEVERLIAAGANVNKAPRNIGATPLYVASFYGHLTIVERLIAAGAYINNGRTTDGVTPLYVASEKGHLDIVERLLAAGADVNKARTDIRATPLFVASEKGHLSIVERLIAANADVNKSRTDIRATPLYIASFYGHLTIVERLIDAGADVNKARTTDGVTPLYLASEKGHLDIVERLIAAGADLNKARTDIRATPLFVASEKGHMTIVDKLLTAGADTTIRTKNGKLPIDVAKTEEIRDLLSGATAVTESVNFNAPNNNSGPLYNALLTDEITEGNILGFFPNNTGKIYPSQGILVRKATNGPYTKSAAWRSVLESGKNPFTRAPLGPPRFRKVHVKAKTRRGGRRANARTRRGRDLQRSS